MINNILEKLEDKIDKIKEKKNFFKRKPAVCVVGQVSAGKSSFLNLLLGGTIFQSSIGETTTSITKVQRNGIKLFIYELKNRKFRIKKTESTGSIMFSDFLSFLDIIDVPGYDGNYDEKKIASYLKEGKYDIVLYILDISKGLTKKDKEFLELLKEKEPYVLFIFNKIDVVYDEEEKENFRELINDTKQHIEKMYPINRILGYVLTSAKKFKNNTTLTKFLQDIIIIASYVSTFKTNLKIIKDGLIRNFNIEMSDVKSKDKYYINFYLKELKNGLYEISSFDIITNAEGVIKDLIEKLNFRLALLMNDDISEIGAFIIKETNKTKELINDMSISYIEILDLDLYYGFDQWNLMSNISFGSMEQSTYSDEMLNEVINGLMISVGGGILAELALGALIPGIGTLVFLGALAYAFMNLKNKADEVRTKVYNEVSRRLPSIIRDNWKKICNEIEKSYIQQIDAITKNKEIDEFLDKLIFGAYNMNEELQNFIIYNIDKLYN